jgi:hypothetical protein
VTVSSHLSRHDVARLLAAVAPRTGSRRPTKDRVDGETARHALVAALHAAVAAGAVTPRDRDIWIAATGIDGWRHTRADIARAYGVGPARVDQVRRQVTDAVAAHLTPDSPPTTPARGPGSGSDPEHAVALVHGEAALLGRDEQVLEAMRTVRRDRLNRTVRRTPTPRAGDAARAARARHRRLLDARVEQVARSGVDVPAALIDLVRTVDLSDVPGAQEMLGEPRTLPDPDWAAGLVTTVGFPYDARQDKSRALAAVQAFIRHPVPPDPPAEARALLAAGQVWISERHPAALWALPRAARLADGDARTRVQAQVFHAVALRHHGYLGAAYELTQRVRHGLLSDRSMPAEDRWGLALELMYAYGSASPYYLDGTDPLPLLQWSLQRIIALRRATEERHVEPAWRATAARRTVMTEHLLTVAQAAADGVRRPSWSASLRQRIDELDAQSEQAGPFNRLNWLVTRTRMAIDLRDRSWFLAGVEDFAAAYRSWPWHPILLEDMATLVAGTQPLGWPTRLDEGTRDLLRGA